MRYWIGSAALDQVKEAEAGGYIEGDQSSYGRLRTLALGDMVVFYSSHNKTEGGLPLQAFTAVGCVADEDPYQVDVGSSFNPWRRRVAFFDGKQANIRPLISSLTFITDATRWGLPFRKGIFEIEAGDFKRIVKAMKADLKGFDHR